jgi:hypothetical protein
MREIRLSGSVRGVRRKPYPYRDRPTTAAQQRGFMPLDHGVRFEMAQQNTLCASCKKRGQPLTEKDESYRCVQAGSWQRSE